VSNPETAWILSPTMHTQPGAASRMGADSENWNSTPTDCNGSAGSPRAAGSSTVAWNVVSPDAGDPIENDPPTVGASWYRSPRQVRHARTATP
jgi:hypothetical protein